MSEYILDGELHALNKHLGYAGYVISDQVSFSNEDSAFVKVCDILAKKYNYYRNEHGKKPIPSFISEEAKEDVVMIFRPAFGDAPATLGIKFTRYEDDGLS